MWFPSACRSAPQERRTGGHFCGPGFTGLPEAKPSSTFAKAVLGQVFISVLPNQHHRRIHAGAKALDLLPAEIAVGERWKGIVVDAVLAHFDQVGRAAQTGTAWCRRPGRGLFLPTCSTCPTSACWRSRLSTPCFSSSRSARKPTSRSAAPRRAGLRGAADLIGKVCQHRIHHDPFHLFRRRQFQLGGGRVPWRLRECADGADLEGHL